MTREDINLLLKDLCARLPYGVKAQVKGWDETKEEEVNIPLKVYSINTDGYVYFESNDYDVNYVSVEDCLLFLRPMSSMTDEEYRELRAVFYNGSNGLFNENSHIDWLNANHFDYRGLIEKGLALETPEGMYEN